VFVKVVIVLIVGAFLLDGALAAMALLSKLCLTALQHLGSQWDSCRQSFLELKSELLRWRDRLVGRLPAPYMTADGPTQRSPGVDSKNDVTGFPLGSPTSGMTPAPDRSNGLTSITALR
jgi:hypothetical protein